MTQEELKDIIANNDMDVAVVQNHPETIDSYLRDMGHFVTMREIVSAVNALRKDAYYSMLIQKSFGK